MLYYIIELSFFLSIDGGKAHSEIMAWRGDSGSPAGGQNDRLKIKRRFSFNIICF